MFVVVGCGGGGCWLLVAGGGGGGWLVGWLPMLFLFLLLERSENVFHAG